MSGYEPRGADEPTDYLAERLREAIATEPDVHELGIEFKVTGQRVLLSGSTSTPTQRAAATGEPGPTYWSGSRRGLRIARL